jgi:murein DD-endopeptidase MepM/ murein hydrolase activator NlpD
MLLCPVRGPLRITQHYDGRPAYYKKYGLASHAGLDITGARAGASVPVYSPVEGEVIKAGPDGDLGLCVRVLTAPNWEGVQREVVLGHHRELFVKKGDFVAQLQEVGRMGKTGGADGVHVHFAHRLWKSGKVLNADNGNKGWLPFGPPGDPEGYLVFHADPREYLQGKLVTYPYA